MLKAVIYNRVSTAGQATDDHVSLDTQETTCTRYAEGKGWEIVRHYRDVDSGSNVNRAQYQLMLADAVAGKFEAIIVYNSSRWGRDAAEASRTYDYLEAQGVKVCSTTGDMDNFLTRGVNGLMDEEHNRRLSRTIRTSLNHMAERGDWPGSKLGIGYRRDEKKRVVIDEETGPMVRRIFTMAANGATFAACQRTLSEWGYPMTETGLKRVLTNPFYRGQVRWTDPSVHLEFKAAKVAYKKGRREKHVFQGNHEALIDEALWQQTQDAIGRRMFKLTRKNDGLSAGLVACGHCGHAASWLRIDRRCTKDGEYTGEMRQYTYLRCYNKYDGTPDCKWSVRAEDVNGWLRRQLRQVTVREDSIARMAALLDAQRDEILAKHELERKAIEHNLRTLRERDTKLLNAMLDDTITKPEYGKRHREFERAMLQAEDELTAFRPAQLPDYGEFFTYLRQLPEALARGDRALRPLLRGMGLRIDIRSKADIRLVGLMEGLL